MSDATARTDTFDEFSYLPEQARELRVTTALPQVERLSFVLDDGRTLSALRFGDGAPEVTFLHGAGLNAHTWDATVLALGAPALAIDLAGHGDSSWRADADYSPRTLADDVAQALAGWAPSPQVLVGQSLGGVTAAAVAAERPDLVEALVIVDITPGVDPTAGPRQVREFFAGPTDWASRDELVDRALSFGLGGTRHQAERGVFLNSRVRPDGRVEWKHHFAHLAAAAIPAGTAPAPVTTEVDAANPAPTLSPTGWSDLDAVASPIVLVRAEQGYVTAHDAEQFQARLPAASIITMSAGHNVQEFVPRELAALINTMMSPDEGSASSPLTPPLG